MIDYQKLPVYQQKNKIVKALKENQVIIVESPTGSGKTTQIPLILHQEGYSKNGILGVTQPRRIATLSVSEFISKQVNKDDNFVGYKMRFYDTTDHSTHIKILTDGMLLMELQNDPLLSDYSVMVVDEAHERSLNIDFVLGLLKVVLEKRKDFKVIISSATINTQVFSKFFNNAPVIKIDTRVFPITIIYKSCGKDLVEPIINCVKTHIKNKKDGDILIFLPGEFNIKEVSTALEYSKIKDNLVIYPLYSRLSKEEQEKVFNPTPKGKTKVVIATNIAETSVTIDNITLVIDSGVAKQQFYNTKNFTSSLQTILISKASCDQRSGRAGRTQSGTCVRLYSKNDYNSRSKYTLEEILRTDLSEVVLRLSSLKVYDYEHFPFITKPTINALKNAETILRKINAINSNRELTPIGELMIKFPLIPRHSRCIVESLLNYPDVIEDVIIGTAFLSTRSPFLFPQGFEDEARNAQKAFSDPNGDFVSYIKAYTQFRDLKTSKEKENWCKKYYMDEDGMNEMHHIIVQLCEICGELGFPIITNHNTKEYLKCMSTGLIQFVCKKQRGKVYKTTTANEIFMHPGSAYFRNAPEFIVAGEIVETTRLYARSVSPLKKEWIDEKLFNSLKIKSNENKVFSNDKNSIYGIKSYSINHFSKNTKLLVVDAKNLKDIANKHNKTRRREKNRPAVLLLKNHYAHYGDSLYHIIALNNVISLDKEIQNSVPSTLFKKSDIKRLQSFISSYMLYPCVLHKKRKILGFIELDVNSKGEYFFHINKSLSEALDTCLYSLSILIDSNKNNKDIIYYKKLYNNLLKLI